MNDGTKISICIVTDTEERQLSIANSIHHQLVGNPDYIDNNIVLNIDVENEIHLYIFDEFEIFLDERRYASLTLCKHCLLDLLKLITER